MIEKCDRSVRRDLVGVHGMGVPNGSNGNYMSLIRMSND